MEKHFYFSSVFHQNLFFKKIGQIIHWVKLLFFLITNKKKNDKVVIYHSLDHLYWLNLYKKIGGHFILEIEDVFSELSEKTKKFKRKEWQLIRTADAYICVNDLIKKKIAKNALCLISYGNYICPSKEKIVPHTDIRLVYAGVIEQERKAAFLAVESMLYLSDEYTLTILGFGSQENITALENLIENVNKKTRRNCVSFQGRKSGREYFSLFAGL